MPAFSCNEKPLVENHRFMVELGHAPAKPGHRGIKDIKIYLALRCAACVGVLTMTNRNESALRKRFHIVLIPGFGGFDALGKIEYYAGVTRIFQQWNTGKSAVLHYFDNLPTAAVVTRATRLQGYLAKRMARGEILEDDDIILVGHSTGGLDIRQLTFRPARSTEPRGPRRWRNSGAFRGHPQSRVPRGVPLRAPLGHQHRRLGGLPRLPAQNNRHRTARRHRRFTSVPARSAGKSDRRRRRLPYRRGSAAGLRRTRSPRPTNAYGEPGPQRTAEAHEAAAELALYFRDMASDFHVIEDLTSQPPDSEPKSPAHFNREQRKKEIERWNHPPIETLSYATVASSPFRFVPDSPAPVWDLANPCTYPEISKDARLSANTDVSYRLCYRACAGGPFQRPAEGGKVTRYLNGAPQGRLEIWDNDGIVNTLSMLWPKGPNVLVAGDHLDIVGHYKPVKVETRAGRIRLQSGPRVSVLRSAEIGSEVQRSDVRTGLDRNLQFLRRQEAAELSALQDTQRDHGSGRGCTPGCSWRRWGPVFRGLGAKDLGTSDNYPTEKMSGGHTTVRTAVLHSVDGRLLQAAVHRGGGGRGGTSRWRGGMRTP